MADLIPSSLTRERRGVVMRGSVEWVPLYCASCGADGGLVTKASLDALGNFAFYICDACDEKHPGAIPGHVKIPMEVYWEHVRNAMLENDGRILTEIEIRAALGDPNHYLSKLERDAPR